MSADTNPLQPKPEARAIETVTRAPLTIREVYQPRSLKQAMWLAGEMCNSGLCPDALRGKPRDCLQVMMMGADLGMSVTESFRAIFVDNRGKVGILTSYIIARVQRSPDCLYFQMLESSDKRSIWECQRKGQPKPTKMSWTWDQAERAGITGPTKSGQPSTWMKYPEAMLRWRCAKALADTVFPDVTYGFPSAEELPDLPDDSPSPIPANVTAPPKMEVVSTTVNAPPKPKPEAAVTQRTDGHAEAPFQSEEPPMPESEEPPAAEPQTTTVPPPDNTDAEVATWVKAVEAARTPADMADLAEGLTSKPEAIRKHPKLKTAWMKRQAEIRK